MNLVLGVDGGNTKTDYFLANEEGHLVAFIRSGSCSQENLPDREEGSYRIMSSVMTQLFKENGINPSDISAAVFGLAGVDTPHQKEAIERVVKRFGFKKSRVVNDCFIPIKAGTLSSIGVSVINGTGTSVGAVDDNGTMLQVGGIGELSSDFAGGHYIARSVVRAAYDDLFKRGEKTTLTPVVTALYQESDPVLFMQALTEKGNLYNDSSLTLACFAKAREGDRCARKILSSVGETLARSACGAIRSLSFKEPVEIVLAGSVWIKGNSSDMKEAFKRVLEEASISFELRPLAVPPATGAILWALEDAMGCRPSKALRASVFESVTDKLKEIEGTRK